MVVPPTNAGTYLLLLKLHIAEYEFNKETFLEHNDVALTPLGVTEMTINELESELELIREAYQIFKGTGPEGAPSSLQNVIDMYAQRMRDIENEIFERRVLV